ncbi:MAG: RIP metalloprotease RseP [Lachnospiraceae bacterium]|nr:RIP metalloprotease RseP [Lachnospiraceae bacterium]
MKIIIALLIFAVIVFIHELGHFILAKANGVGVTEFAVGMGPKLFSFNKGETMYSIRILPLGGYCSMIGEDEASEAENALNNKTVWQRFWVLFAGPLFNFVLAFVLAIILIALIGADRAEVIDVQENSPAYKAGLQAGDIVKEYNGYTIGVGREIYISDFVDPVSDEAIDIVYERNGDRYETVLEPELLHKYYFGMTYNNNGSACEMTVVKGGAMEKAGIKTGDILLAIGDNKFSSGEEFYEYSQTNETKKDTVDVTYERDGKEYTVKVTPTENKSYYTGFTYNSNYTDVNKKVGVLGVLKYSLLEVRYQIKSVILSLKYIITGHASKDSIAGPVGIVNMVGDVYEQSSEYGVLAVLESLISFTIMISANLGVMNLLPIPALDGGRILFVIIEMIRGKKIDPDKEGFVHFIGFVLLMGLMVLVMYNDISNIFFKK